MCVCSIERSWEKFHETFKDISIEDDKSNEISAVRVQYTNKRTFINWTSSHLVWSVYFVLCHCLWQNSEHYKHKQSYICDREIAHGTTQHTTQRIAVATTQRLLKNRNIREKSPSWNDMLELLNVLIRQNWKVQNRGQNSWTTDFHFFSCSCHFFWNPKRRWNKNSNTNKKSNISAFIVCKQRKKEKRKTSKIIFGKFRVFCYGQHNSTKNGRYKTDRTEIDRLQIYLSNIVKWHSNNKKKWFRLYRSSVFSTKTFCLASVDCFVSAF